MLKLRLDRLLQGFVIGLAVPTLALGAAMTSTDYSAAKTPRRNGLQGGEGAVRDSLSGNPKDVCVAEAKAAEKKTIAEAEAQYKNTDKARADAKIAAAEADYDVAKAKCGARPATTRTSV